MSAHAESDRPVLLAYDGSEDAKYAIAQAARLFGGRPAVVVSIIQDVAAIPAFAWAAPGALSGFDEMLDAVQAAGERMAAEGAAIATQAGLQATSAAANAVGPVWDAIVQLAEERDAAAIVMGSRGFGGVKSALLGSVSNGVVHHARRPVVVVRRPDDVTAER
jgi:nucleotide-binding universal stress UspA family protein